MLTLSLKIEHARRPRWNATASFYTANCTPGTLKFMYSLERAKTCASFFTSTKMKYFVLRWKMISVNRLKKHLCFHRHPSLSNTIPRLVTSSYTLPADTNSPQGFGVSTRSTVKGSIRSSSFTLVIRILPTGYRSRKSLEIFYSEIKNFPFFRISQVGWNDKSVGLNRGSFLIRLVSIAILDKVRAWSVEAFDDTRGFRVVRACATGHHCFSCHPVLTIGIHTPTYVPVESHGASLKYAPPAYALCFPCFADHSCKFQISRASKIRAHAPAFDLPFIAFN